MTVLIHQPRAQHSQSEKPTIHETCHIVHSQFGAWTSIGAYSEILESTIGDYTYAMEDVTINYADIGKFTSIASHCCINPVQHPMQRATQHHMTYRRKAYGLAPTDDEQIFDWRRQSRVQIGHDVWLGHGAIIMKNVTIGHGAVVGSGAVVTKDVEPYQIVVGVPAKPVKFRFSSDQIERLMRMSWWDRSDEWIRERYLQMNHLEEFLEKYDI
jgi:phosphonate metabolism protein (transferase hexapeptide repeat family)